MKLLFAALLPFALLLSSTLELANAATPKPSILFCGAKCKERCKKAAVNDRCLKYRGICCRECECVPSETYGNKCCSSNTLLHLHVMSLLYLGHKIK